MHPANNVTQVTIFANFNNPKNLKTFKSRKLRSRHKDKYDFLLFLLLFYKLDFWLVKLRNFMADIDFFVYNVEFRKG